MKGVLLWLVLRALRAGIRDFGPALAALVGQVKNIFCPPYTISTSLSLLPNKLGTGKAIVPGRLSVNVCLWSSPSLLSHSLLCNSTKKWQNAIAQEKASSHSLSSIG